MNQFSYSILSAIPHWEITRYFEGICTHNEGENTYLGDGWVVHLTFHEPKVHRMIKLPQTTIDFSGEQEACEKVIESYRKAFMRGGA